MSVSAALNHTAETQDKDMDDNFEKIIDAFAESLLGEHSEARLTSIDMKYKWMGGNGDSARPEKNMPSEKRTRKLPSNGPRLKIFIVPGT